MPFATLYEFGNYVCVFLSNAKHFIPTNVHSDRSRLEGHFTTHSSDQLFKFQLHLKCYN